MSQSNPFARVTPFLCCFLLHQHILAGRSALAFVLRPCKYHASPLSTSIPWTVQHASRRESSLSDYSDAEVNDMESLIRSLSASPTDESRRSQVAQIFEDTFAAVSDSDVKSDTTNPTRFCQLFDKVLIRMGDQVQQEAAAAAAAAAISNELPTTNDKAAETSDPATRRVKTKEELQLWALVDMMVQSKTIVKRMTGELGKDGAFG